MKRLILFTTTDCPNCDKLNNILNELNISIPVEKINIVSNLDICMHYGVQIAPTLIMLDNENEEVRRLSGDIMEPSDLNIWINKT